MTDFKTLAFKALEKMKKIVNNVNSYLVFFGYYIGDGLRKRLEYFEKYEISKKIVEHFINSKDFEDYLKEIRNEVERMKKKVGSFEYKDLLLRGRLFFNVDFSDDLYVEVYVDDFKLVFRNVPIKSKDDILEVIPFDTDIRRKYKIDGNGMTGLEELKKEIMKKVREVIDNVDEFKIDIYFHIYGVKIPLEIENEIIYEAVKDLINRKEFKEFLNDLKYKIEDEKIWYLKYKDKLQYLLEGIIRFNIDYENDFYIEVKVDRLRLLAGKLPMKKSEEIAGISTIPPAFEEFELNENVKKKLLLYVV